MDPLNLSGIDRPLAPVVLGTMTFGDSVDERAAGSMIERAAGSMIEDFLAAGGTGIDTANGYAGGRSESMLGELLDGGRDQVVLATKVGIPHPDGDDTAPLSSTASTGAWPAACAGWTPTTSTCCTCTSPTDLPRSRIPSRPSRTC
jgi:aryl-alcohol dehydrogenase-like predicted oxidoreductase